MFYKRFFLVNLIFIVFSSVSFAQRDEIDRYKLLNDRELLKRKNFHQRVTSYLDLNFAISSGLWGLVGEINNASDSATTPSEETQNVLNIINQNINTERHVHLGFSVGVPLPSFYLSDWKFSNYAFFEQRIGTGFSFSNERDPTDPEASVYLMMDQELGFSSLIDKKGERSFSISLYQLTRQDFYALRTSQDIASNNEIFNFDDLENQQKTIELDLSYKEKLNKYFFYNVGLRELTLSESEMSIDSDFGKRPLFWHQLSYQNHGLMFYFGQHFRERYSLAKGMFIGGEYSFERHLPLKVRGHMTIEDLTIMPRIQLKHFYFQYAFKTPYNNPQDDIWVSASHQISLGIPL